MTPADLEAQALAAGASPDAAAAARAFCEALPEGTAMPTIDREMLETYGSLWLDFSPESSHFVCVQCRKSEYSAVFGTGRSEGWRPGQPIPPRVLELIARVGT